VAVRGLGSLLTRCPSATIDHENLTESFGFHQLTILLHAEVSTLEAEMASKPKY